MIGHSTERHESWDQFVKGDERIEGEEAQNWLRRTGKWGGRLTRTLGPGTPCQRTTLDPGCLRKPLTLKMSSGSLLDASEPSAQSGRRLWLNIEHRTWRAHTGLKTFVPNEYWVDRGAWSVVRIRGSRPFEWGCGPVVGLSRSIDIVESV